MVGMFGRLRNRNDRGAALVEAAIVMPLLLMLTLGIWTTARAWNVHNVLDHAAREAARYGAVDATVADILTVAQGEVEAARIDWATVTPCVAVFSGDPVGYSTGSPGGPCIGPPPGPGTDPTTDSRIQIRLEIQGYNLDFIFFSFPVDLAAQAVSRMEPQ